MGTGVQNDIDSKVKSEISFFNISLYLKQFKIMNYLFTLTDLYAKNLPLHNIAVNLPWQLVEIEIIKAS